ncbi:MAG: translesion error-prone DNA polymerase V autoproteolytic subunit [Candidatus Latescibacteria bacterium]|nr:translesion error-prone DNA polymerase V autoproteolytic subunit [Candidatus Latescibacterota bacterium]
MSRPALTVVDIAHFLHTTIQPIPFFDCQVPAGFPSPADDYLEQTLDLNELLIEHPVATFYVRVEGDSMEGAGIHSGDILVVDRALEPDHNRIIVALLDGAFTVKRMLRRQGRVFLAPDNPTLDILPVDESMNFEVWGVVTYAIHPVK